MLKTTAGMRHFFNLENLFIGVFGKRMFMLNLPVVSLRVIPKHRF